MNVKMSQFIGKVKLGAKRNAPELLLGAGLITGTACVVLSGKATIKAAKITDKFKGDIDTISKSLESENLTPVEIKNEIRPLYAKYALDLAKNYAVPTALYAATVASIFASYKIQKNRQIALSTALSAMTTAYATLLGKVQNGAKHGLTAQEVLDGVEGREVVDPETGEITIEKVQGDPINYAYQVRFDNTCLSWEKDKLQNEFSLKAEENWANDLLQLQGYLFLNDVYDRLGIPKVKTGFIVGWLKDGNGDGFVDFGVIDAESYDDVRYDRNAFDLTFNVDGDILTNFPDYKGDK